MKFSKMWLCVLVGLAGFLLLGVRVKAVSTSALPDSLNKIIIYPSGNETINQLRQLGIADVEDFGSYWIAEATGKQVDAARHLYGSRLILANYLNRISLLRGSIDTTTGDQFEVPAKLREPETKGRRLRLIQFKGPIQPQWLADLNKLAGLKIINYVPSDAYLVFMDETTEGQVRALKEMGEPIQWIGPYHPYYKMGAALQNTLDTVDVYVGLVDSPEGEAALKEITSYVDRSSPTPTRTLNQLTTKIQVSGALLTHFARMPEVLWIEPVMPVVKMDEVQALIVSSHTNNTPGFGPIPLIPIPSAGETYLNFLTNAVGGGSLPTGMLPAFTNSDTYPIVDVADSGFSDNASGYNIFDTNGMVLTSVPATDFDFFPFGNPAEADRYRVVYAAVDVSCGTFHIDKVTAAGGAICIPEADLNGPDLGGVPHGTAAASIIVGYNTNAGDRDASGFQFGMGVSPFGLVGSTRVFQPTIDMIDANVCNYKVYDTFCANSIPALVLNEYGAGARIANNSWGQRLVVNSNDGLYDNTCQSYDVGVRDSQQMGQTGGGTTNGTPNPFPQNQELIVVCANGNAGSQGNVGGFSDITITPPATAKNVITVGATENVRLDGSGCLAQRDEDNSYNIASYSSFGPARDGRFKPEIVAPGGPVYAVASPFWFNYVTDTQGLFPVLLPPTDLYGPSSDLNYLCTVNGEVDVTLTDTNVFGSSFSAPAVSGGIQLLWWYFQNRLNMLQPSPAMAKAYLLNSARYLPITNGLFGVEDSLPSIAQGMGELDLRRMFDSVPRVLRDESSPRAIDTPLITTNPAPQQTYFSKSGQSYEVSGLVASNNLPFRVTLAWTDAPGTSGAGTELVNDLNLEVTIGGQTYFGNRFNGHNSVSTDTGGGAATPDSLNPVESVFLDPAISSAVTSGAPWKVVVRAFNIAGTGVYHVGTNGNPNQDFALVVYNTVTNFPTVTDVPITTNALPAGTTNNLCSTALNITQFPYTFTNTLSKAVYSNVQPSPSVARGGIDEFFRISQPTPGTAFTVDTFGSAFDTVLSVWSAQVVPQAIFIRGECGFLAEAAANLDAPGGGLQSQLSFTADGSNDYFIVVEPHNNGPGGQMVLNVQATRPPITVTPAALVFSNQVVGTTSPSQTIIYQNNASVPVQISTVSITGSNAADFSIISQTCEGNSLVSGTNCFVTVAFSPSDVGARIANLVFVDNATGSPRTIPLTGTGTPAAPLVCTSLSTNSLNFGPQLLTTTSTVQSITITNCGSAALNVTSVSLSGFASNDFSFSQGCTGGPVPPDSTCTINVTFTPQTAGARKANLVIASDAAGSPIIVALNGTSAALLPAICFPSGSVDFGSVTAGATGLVQSIVITNCGTAALVISNLTLTGANAGDFITNSTTCSTVVSGGTCVVNVQFAPSASGPRSASLGFVDNAAGSPHIINLTGGGSSDQPDASIGKSTSVKKMVGRGVINSTGAAQEIVQKIKRGGKKPVKFYINVQNVGTSDDSFLVLGTGSTAGFTVHYFIGAVAKESADITSQVVAGTFSTSTLASGAITSIPTMIRVEVLAADKTLLGAGATQTFMLTFTSANDPSKVDAVNATVTAK